MSWSEAQRGKEMVKKIVGDIDGAIVCTILEPIGEDFEKGLYPVALKRGRNVFRLKIPMEELERIDRNQALRRRIRQRLERIIQKKVA